MYSPEQVQAVVELFLAGADRDKLDPILDACVAVYTGTARRGRAGGFQGQGQGLRPHLRFPRLGACRTRKREWEKLSILLNLLTPKLPAPKEEDLAKGILEAIDMDSYRVEKKAAMKIALADEDAEIEPVPTDGGGQQGRAGTGPPEQHPQDVQ